MEIFENLLNLVPFLKRSVLAGISDGRDARKIITKDFVGMPNIIICYVLIIDWFASDSL